MKDCLGVPLQEGDPVILYYGYNELKKGTIHVIKGNRAKVIVSNTISKWKPGCCMVKWKE